MSYLLTPTPLNPEIRLLTRIVELEKKVEALEVDSQIALEVTSLPAAGSVPNGTVIHYLVSATSGVMWRLRYRSTSASANKWEFLGGGVMLSTDGTLRNLSSGTYNPPTSDGLTRLTIPLTGQYLVRWGARHQDLDGYSMGTAARYNGLGADSSWELNTNMAISSTGYNLVVSTERELTLNAGTDFWLEHWTANPTPSRSRVLARFMTIQPRRVQ